MRVNLKAKLTGLISFLVLLVVLASSTVYLSSLTRRALGEVESKAEYVANSIDHQVRTVLAQVRFPRTFDPNDREAFREFARQALAADKGLASSMESAIGYSPTIYYVALTDEHQDVLLHTDPGEVGRRFSPMPPFRQLVRASLTGQLRVIYGSPRVYEVLLPFGVPRQAHGDVRVGVSTLFLRAQITPELRTAMKLSILAILLATFSAGLVSFRLLRPLEAISRSVDRLARGEYVEPVKLDRKDEWGILSSKLNLLGEHLRGEKAAYVQLKENLNQLVANLVDGLLLFDKSDRLVLATPAVARFIGRSPDALVHLMASEVFSRVRPLDELVRAAFGSRRSLGWQTVQGPGPAEALRVAVNVQFVEEEGELVGSLVTLRDAGTRAQLEDQIDISTKLAAIGRLTAGVAHEVKNPLNAMVLQVELLRSKLGDEGGRVMPQLETLSTEIRRLDRVVKTFLDFNRPVELRPAETEVETLVREVFTLAEPQARKNNVRLVFEGNGNVPHVRVDRDLIKQALLNLVLNGCQAMPAGGELKVTPRATSQHVELEIADQGVGIPPADRPKIFSLYYTTKPNGTGVGLAMAFRIIQLHNGSIDFSSEVDRGTTFRVSLPR